MSLYSTRNRNIRASWRDAVLSGIAPDGGLYLPIELPRLVASDLASLRALSFVDLATHLASRCIGTEVPRHDLERICCEAFSFPVELHRISETLYTLELFHGPTCAFKDFGARFMAGLFRHFWGRQERQLTVVVATSGDTGSAVAHAFLDTRPMPPIRVAILYPKGKVSEIQRKQMTTLGHNVTAYEVDGTFDDCQALVKAALCDQKLASEHPLTSANSINIARLLPQMFYYAYATLRFSADLPPLFSVPSGNLGNLTAGIMAHCIGCPAARFIAACNANETFPRFLTTGSFAPHRSIETLSNAMDVGNPSNFYRITELLSQPHSIIAVRELLSGYSITDQETLDTIASFYRSYGYTLDPHTAVGACALSHYRATHPNHAHPAVLVATAHPAKFPDVVQSALGHAPEVPPPLQSVLTKAEERVPLPNEYSALVDALRGAN